MELVSQKTQLALIGRKQFWISELVSDNEAGISYYKETVGYFPELSMLKLVWIPVAQILLSDLAYLKLQYFWSNWVSVPSGFLWRSHIMLMWGSTRSQVPGIQCPMSLPHYYVSLNKLFHLSVPQCLFLAGARMGPDSLQDPFQKCRPFTS